MSLEMPNAIPAVPELPNDRLPHIGDPVRINVVGTVESDWEIASVDAAGESVSVKNKKNEIKTLTFAELRAANRWLFAEHGPWDEDTATDIRKPPSESGTHRIVE